MKSKAKHTHTREAREKKTTSVVDNSNVRNVDVNHIVPIRFSMNRANTTKITATERMRQQTNLGVRCDAAMLPDEKKENQQQQHQQQQSSMTSCNRFELISMSYSFDFH